MLGPSLATLLVALTLGFAPSAPGSTADALTEARGKLAVDDGVAAVAILESALPEAGAGKDKDAVLALLRQAYEAAAKQAQAAGRAAEADGYRENLKILARKPRPARPTTPAPAPAPSPRPPTEQPTPIVEPTARPEAPSPTLERPTLLPDEPDTSIPPALPVSTPPAEPVKVPSTPTAKPAAPEPVASDLATADAAFVAEDYLEAGRIYSKLARERRLPADRRDHWFYCRAFAVVARINAKPKDEEWATLNAEIDQIRALNPQNYLGEYLRNLAAERQGPARKPRVSRAMVVRGSAPEEQEPAVVDRPVRPASTVAAADAPPPAPTAPTPAQANSAPARLPVTVPRWQLLDTANFRIYHADPALAGKVAQAAESARRDLIKRWSKQPNRPSWQPPCEIYLYPTAKQYATMTGQAEDSPGFSTMGMNAGRITSRRINLRADHPTLVQAVLPHEITHVLLADHFTERQIPRWADEGMAVLSEPDDEQQRRAADLIKPLGDNRVFAIDALMNMDYPDERYWNLYYAQSVSLTRFLVEQGTPTQMVQFLQDAQRDGYEPALRRVYKIEGFTDLQRRWVPYARARAAQQQGVAATQPDVKVR